MKVPLFQKQSKAGAANRNLASLFEALLELPTACVNPSIEGEAREISIKVRFDSFYHQIHQIGI
jgi:hypothetical protein